MVKLEDIMRHYKPGDLVQFDSKTEKVIDGVGADAEVVVNANGGKQSKSPAALHLVDPYFLQVWFDSNDPNSQAGSKIAGYMRSGDQSLLYEAIDELESDSSKALLTIGKVLMYGAERYAPGNWRLIPREEHINHALIHLVAALAGDTQDDHIGHAMCRLMMAISTVESEGFNYTKPCLSK